MTVTEEELEERLQKIEDPAIGEDIVSLGLVNDVQIEDDTATVSLAFNTPYAPAEMDLGNQVRDTIAEAGLTPQIRADVTEEQGFDQEVMPNIRNVIAVASGKGGVGKTTVAANIAAGLERKGAYVGLLDADIHGPNVPRVLPVEDEPGVTPDEEKIVPPDSDGVRVMSMGFLIENEDDPAILRGPMINNVMTHFQENVEWGTLDYLVVDLPPGTGDASLDLLQNLPVTGTAIVTTPQEMAITDARKGLRLFEKHDTPILGIVENMSTFKCDNCGDEHDPFGQGGAERISEEYGVTNLGSLPIHGSFGAEGSAGTVVKDDDSPVQAEAFGLVERVVDRVSEVNRRQVGEEVGSLSEDDDEDPGKPAYGADTPI